MLKDRILWTLRFFDLQQTPLSLSELQDFLFNEPEKVKAQMSAQFELNGEMDVPPFAPAEQLQAVIESDLKDEVDTDSGFYCLAGRKHLINERLSNAPYKNYRERLIKRFLPPLKHIPFVRGVAVGGSHTIGRNRPDSDIDLLVILDPDYLWLGRLLVTGYIQMTGHRRHGARIANRFCLNHYLAGPIAVSQERDPYNAMEYLRLRPEIYPSSIRQFAAANYDWVRKFFPNARQPEAGQDSRSGVQNVLEMIFRNFFGSWLNRKLGGWQMAKIMKGQPAVATQSELAFHSKQRKFEFLKKVFEK